MSLLEKILYKRTRGLLRGGLLERLFLESAIKRAVDRKGKVLLLGSSYAQYGGIPSLIKGATLVAAPSQDIYYSTVLAQNIMGQSEGKVDTCVLILGYYALFQDLSLQTRDRVDKIGGTFWPVLGDSHNWENPYNPNHWHKGYRYPNCVKRFLERKVYEYFYGTNSYFDDMTMRDTQKHTSWKNLSLQERRELAYKRADRHNKLYKYQDACVDNCKKLQSFVQKNGQMQLLYVIPPFSKEYCEKISEEMIIENERAMKKLNINFIDFNRMKKYSSEYFIDADHLNDEGAKKFTSELVEVMKQMNMI